MKALHRKLVRDLIRLRGQVLTIAVVTGCGIASYVASISTYRSLSISKETYYQESRFAHITAHLYRAPDRIFSKIRSLPTVTAAEKRVVENVWIDMEMFSEPISAKLVSINARRGNRLNEVYVAVGRMVNPGNPNEVLISEAFAEAHELKPGDSLRVVMNGRKTHLRAVGIAFSPEYVLATSEVALWSDPKRFGVLWMDDDAVAAAFDMKGLFNDVVVTVAANASHADVISRLDQILRSWGGTHAYGRDRQPSERFLAQELRQLRGMAIYLPTIFLGVAAFLLNIVLSRMIATQREQIAALKALGYSDFHIGLHFLQLTASVLAIGAAIGIALGTWGGRFFVRLYADYFRFPILEHRTELSVLSTAAFIAAAAGLIGTLSAVRRVVILPPAEAMRPEAPVQYRQTFVERIRVYRWISVSARMMLRDIIRRPLRALFSMIAIACAVAIVIAGSASQDAIKHLLNLQFERIQHEDVTVLLSKPRDRRAVHEIGALPGVRRAEGRRVVPMRLFRSQRSRDVVVTGVPTAQKATLTDFRDADGRILHIPSTGLVLSEKLGELLGIHAGDSIAVEILEEEHPHRNVRVTALVHDLVGLSAYAAEPFLYQLVRESPRVSTILVSIENDKLDSFYQRIKRFPWIAGTTRRHLAIELFQKQTAKMLLTWTIILACFAAAIAIGVVYNNARIALETRARDFTSLRVLGFSEAEVFGLMLSEQALHLAIGIPVGLVLGHVLTTWLYTTVESELFRIPVIISTKTQVSAVLILLAAALVSGWSVRQRIAKLDLVAVLKARD